MEKIICFLNLFTTYQRVYIVDETNNLKPVGEFLFADLAEKLAELSDAVNLNHIMDFGKDFEVYILNEKKTVNNMLDFILIAGKYV